YLAERSSDLGRAVQHESSAHPRRGAGIDLVEQRGAEEVGAGNRCDEAIVAGIECALIVIVGVVDADLRPGVDSDIIVVVRIRLEARQPRLIENPARVVGNETVEEGAAVSGHSEPEQVRSEEADERFGDIASLEDIAEVAAGSFLVHRIEEISGPTLASGLRSPERGIE